MSTKRLTFVVCDQCGQHSAEGLGTAQDARNHAEMEGWLCGSRRDYCPYCKEADR